LTAARGCSKTGAREDLVQQIPEMMRAVRLVGRSPEPVLEVRRVAVPHLGPGQVLVRVTAAPIHSADLAFCAGTLPSRRPMPATPGTEGSGEVVASGGGLVGRMLVGRRVAVLARPDGEGTWADYVATDASLCMPLSAGIPSDEGSMLLLNPLTALAAIDVARASAGKGLILTGASGALGRMIARLGAREGLAVVAVVRRSASAETLLREGASEVILQDDPDLLARLRRAARAWRALVGIDTVGGAVCGELLAALPDGGSVVALGRQSLGPCAIDPLELVFHNKQLRGFWLFDHLQDTGATAMLQAFPRLRRSVDALRTGVSERIPLDEVPARCAAMLAPSTGPITLSGASGKTVVTIG
jgi:NADPH2:quinone reductase